MDTNIDWLNKKDEKNMAKIIEVSFTPGQLMAVCDVMRLVPATVNNYGAFVEIKKAVAKLESDKRAAVIAVENSTAALATAMAELAALEG